MGEKESRSTLKQKFNACSVKEKEKKFKKLLRKIDENQSRNLFFVTQHFDEKNNLLNNLRHIKKKEKLRTSSKQLLHLRKRKKCLLSNKNNDFDIYTSLPKEKKLVKLKEDKKINIQIKNFQPGID